MIRNNEGLTKTYNRFHDPNEIRPTSSAPRAARRDGSRRSRRLRLAGPQPACEFIPEFEDEEDEDDNGRPKKKKYRYKWPEAIHERCWPACWI